MTVGFVCVDTVDGMDDGMAAGDEQTWSNTDRDYTYEEVSDSPHKYQILTEAFLDIIFKIPVGHKLNLLIDSIFLHF